MQILFFDHILHRPTALFVHVAKDELKQNSAALKYKICIKLKNTLSVTTIEAIVHRMIRTQNKI